MKRGQTKLSFGMIFSIILIIIFISFAFYAIKHFLSLQEKIQLEKFVDDINDDVDELWKSTQGSQTVTYSLPSKVKQVCFANDAYGNLLLKDKKGIPLGSWQIDHLNLDEMLGNRRQICFEVAGGKLEIVLEKNYGQTLVTIKAPSKNN